MGKNAAAKKTGVIRVVRNNSYYTYSDVMELLGCGQSKAYKVIREIRQELIDKGIRREQDKTVCMP